MSKKKIKILLEVTDNAYQAWVKDHLKLGINRGELTAVVLPGENTVISSSTVLKILIKLS